MKVIEEPSRGDALLDMIFANKEEQVRDVKVGDVIVVFLQSPLVEIKILSRGKKAKSITTMDFRRAEFGLFSNLLGRVL